MTAPTYNVLFLCTGNSARSILAEALLNQAGRGTFKAYSAGSHPKGEVHPLALEQLRKAKLPASGYRSKSWSEFSAPDAPKLDFVFTVCDNAANEVCPIWPGQPMPSSSPLGCEVHNRAPFADSGACASPSPERVVTSHLEAMEISVIVSVLADDPDFVGFRVVPADPSQLKLAEHHHYLAHLVKESVSRG